MLTDTVDLASACSSNSKIGMSKKKSTAGRKGYVTKRSLKKSGSFQKDEELMSIGGRDTSLFLFRALGKILYCKSKFSHFLIMYVLSEHSGRFFESQ